MPDALIGIAELIAAFGVAAALCWAIEVRAQRRERRASDGYVDPAAPRVAPGLLARADRRRPGLDGGGVSATAGDRGVRPAHTDRTGVVRGTSYPEATELAESGYQTTRVMFVARD